MSFNIWERWPWTSFQNLNLDWLMKAMKEAVTKAEAVEAEVGTYSQRISDAEAETANAIAIGQEAQGTANSALSAANSALSAANNAQNSANVADTKAENALNDYLDVHITAYENNPFQTTSNVDDILTAVSANKKIRFTLDDTRNDDTYVTFDYQIVTVEDSSTDIDILVYFDTSVSSASLKFFLVTLTKRVGSDSSITYSTIGGDVTFSGGGGGGVADAVLYVVQSLTNSEKAQARSNIGAGHYNIGISQDETIITIADVDTGSVNSYAINKPPYKIPLQYNNGVYTTSITGESFLKHIDDCFMEYNGVHYYLIGVSNSGAFGNAYFACSNPSISGKIENEIFELTLNGTNPCTVTQYTKDIILLPAVSASDNGKFMRVVSGAWEAATVPSAESNSFGGV